MQKKPYIPFPSKMLGMKPEAELDFDVFEETPQGRIVMCYHRHDPLSKDQFNKLLRHEKKPLFVSQEDRQHLINYIGSHSGGLGEGLSLEQKSLSTQVITPFIETAFIEMLNSLPAEIRPIIEPTQAGIEACAYDIASSGTGFSLMLRLFCSHDYLVRHSFLVAALSLAALTEDKREISSQDRRAIVTGALLHDIGMLRIDEDLYAKPDLLPEEWTEMRLHPEVGQKILNLCENIPAKSLAIIAGHHAQPNGRGYGGTASEEALLVGAMDAFASLLVATPYRHKVFNAADAWFLMKEDEGHFDDYALKLINQIFVNGWKKRAA
ncbi:MAG: HD domain-containing protein [Bacteriovoracaceae bacterium]|nr:HD domain-containing protein [Bacteriovoracaceae bacterium]